MRNNFKILIAVFVCAMICSCAVDEPERSSVTSVIPFRVDSATPATISAPESADSTYTVTFTIDDNLKIDGIASISVNPNSTATEDVDFHLNEPEITLHPWQTEYTFTFDVFSDIELEGNETIMFDITTSASPFFESEAGQTVTVDIEDFLTDDLFLTFNWDVSFLFDGDTFTTCPFVDLDVYVLDADGNDLGIYDAATGACPESIVIDGTWDDGTYFLASNMWDNGTLGPLGLDIIYQMTFSGFRQGKIDFTYNPTDNWLSTDLDQTNDGNASFKEVGILTIAGNIYTLAAPDGTVLGTGFRAPHKAANKF